MDKVYIISESYLDELIESNSKELVGKLLKRLELSSDIPSIKLQQKNIVYEQYRGLKALLDAHQNGVEQSKWVFLTKQEGKE